MSLCVWTKSTSDIYERYIQQRVYGTSGVHMMMHVIRSPNGVSSKHLRRQTSLPPTIPCARPISQSERPFCLHSSFPNVICWIECNLINVLMTNLLRFFSHCFFFHSLLWPVRIIVYIWVGLWNSESFFSTESLNFLFSRCVLLFFSLLFCSMNFIQFPFHHFDWTSADSLSLSYIDLVEERKKQCVYFRTPFVYIDHKTATEQRMLFHCTENPNCLLARSFE